MQKSIKNLQNFCAYNTRRGAVFLKEMTSNNLVDIWENAIIETYEPEQIIAQQGDMPQGFYVLITGTLRTTRISESGKQITINLFNSGDMCLEDSLILQTPITINLQAVQPSTVLFVPKSFVSKQLDNNDILAMRLLKSMAINYRATIQHIDVLSIKSPVQRVGYYFLSEYLKKGTPNIFTLPFKKQDVANYLGITPETFSRVIKKIEPMGIAIDNNTVYVKKDDVLCDFCDLDTATMCPKSQECEKFCFECGGEITV